MTNNLTTSLLLPMTEIDMKEFLNYKGQAYLGFLNTETKKGTYLKLVFPNPIPKSSTIYGFLEALESEVLEDTGYTVYF